MKLASLKADHQLGSVKALRSLQNAVKDSTNHGSEKMRMRASQDEDAMVERLDGVLKKISGVTDEDDDYVVTDDQKAAVLELQELAWNYPNPPSSVLFPVSDEDDDDDDYYVEAPPYDVSERLKEVNRQLAEDETPVECDRNIRIRFCEQIAVYQSPRDVCQSDSDDGYGDSSDLLYDVEDEAMSPQSISEDPSKPSPVSSALPKLLDEIPKTSILKPTELIVPKLNLEEDLLSDSHDPQNQIRNSSDSGVSGMPLVDDDILEDEQISECQTNVVINKVKSSKLNLPANSFTKDNSNVNSSNSKYAGNVYIYCSDDSYSDDFEEDGEVQSVFVPVRQSNVSSTQGYRSDESEIEELINDATVIPTVIADKIITTEPPVSVVSVSVHKKERPASAEVPFPEKKTRKKEKAAFSKSRPKSSDPRTLHTSPPAIKPPLIKNPLMYQKKQVTSATLDKAVPVGEPLNLTRIRSKKPSSASTVQGSAAGGKRQPIRAVHSTSYSLSAYKTEKKGKPSPVFAKIEPSKMMRKASSHSDIHKMTDDEEERRSESESVYRSWLLQKRVLETQLKRERQHQRKMAVASEIQEARQRKAQADSAFKAWLHKKREQLKLEKKMRNEKQRLEDHTRYARSRTDCEQAYREWCRRKRAEIQIGGGMTRSQSLERTFTTEKARQLYSAYLPRR